MIKKQKQKQKQKQKSLSLEEMIMIFCRCMGEMQKDILYIKDILKILLTFPELYYGLNKKNKRGKKCPETK